MTLSSILERSDKKRIYQIIDMYLDKTIDADAFCDDFYLSYDLEVDIDALSEDEYKAFQELSEVVGRFSDSEVDLSNYPGVYYSKEELQSKILETRENLSAYFEKFYQEEQEKLEK